MACDHAAQDSRTHGIELRVPGVSLAVPLYQGDFSASGLVEGQREKVVYTNQGKNHTVADGNRVDPSGSFSAHFDGWSDVTKDRVVDFILRRGKYAGNQRSAGNGVPCGKGYLMDIAQLFTDGRSRVFFGCSITLDYASGDPDSLTASWTCYGDVEDYPAPT